MSWVRLDDLLPHHRKLVACGTQAPMVLGWYAASIAFSNRHLTDGVILPADLPLLLPSARPKPSVIGQLVTVGLWEDRPQGGWVIHDFLEWNHSAKDRRAKLQADSDRKSLAASDGNRRRVQADSARIPDGIREDSARIPPVEPILASPSLSTPSHAKPSLSGKTPQTPHGGFERFWAVYPRKVGKDKAAEAWRKKGCEPLTAEILVAVERQRDWLLRSDPAQDKAAGDLCPYPATWLNQGRWQDDPPTRSARTDRNLAGIADWLEERESRG